MKTCITFVLLTFLVVASSASNTRFFPEVNAPIRPINSWVLTTSKQPDRVLEISILLHIENAHVLENKFWEVSNPFHAEYQNYMSMEQIANLVRPKKSSIIALESWLKSFGINSWKTVPSQDVYTFSAKASVLEAMFEVDLFEAYHPSFSTNNIVGGKPQPVSIVRSSRAYSIPSFLKDIIAVVPGLTGFPKMEKRGFPSFAAHNGPQQSFVTPSVIRQNLNIPEGLVGTNKNNSQAVAQFLEQYYSPSDLTTFQRQTNVAINPVAKVVGPNNPSNPGTEASLDIQYIMGVAQDVPTWFVSTAGLVAGQEPFVAWATNLNSMKEIPWVHSVSYGDQESTIDPNFRARLDIELQKLGVRGVSILFASGDNGVGCNDACTSFLPNWPASSPYVTSVGGVFGTSGNWVADTIASGGFSNAYPMPQYQKSAVTSYLKAMTNSNNIPSSKYYNATSRAMPDIGAYSEGVYVVTGGFGMPVGGTSCASPIVAATITLINDKLLNAGKKTLGFLNPLLYSAAQSHPNSFQNVKVGQNTYFCCSGFSANPNGGWCPISGLGVPDVTNMISSFSQILNVNL